MEFPSETPKKELWKNIYRSLSYSSKRNEHFRAFFEGFWASNPNFI